MNTTNHFAYQHNVITVLRNQTDMEIQLRKYEMLALAKGIRNNIYYKHIFNWMNEYVKVLFNARYDYMTAARQIRNSFVKVADEMLVGA